MIKNLSYRKKLKLMGIASILFLLICYRSSISKTIEQHRLYKKQLNTLSQVQDPGSYLQQLEQKDSHIDQLFDRFALDTLNPSKNLLAVVSNYCSENNLQLKEYMPAGIAQKEELNILTRNIIVEGSFVNCLGLVYELETQKKAGRVSSVLFKSYTDSKEKQTKLNCTLFIQNIIENTEDSDN